ncbi:MAG: epoxyqueuosine reductase QueH [Dehalococcoidia bacterium]|nr:epoxyqueuosine reductase QueH [Dehalococcoidia bacterium]
MISSRKLLVHTCCAHCTAYTIEYWREKGYDITGLWYNPNIHPFSEHHKRLQAIRTLSEKMGFQLEVVTGYDFHEYFRQVVGHEDERCSICFNMRLEKVARVAVIKGKDAFTTSLLISPHQEHQSLRTSGEWAANQNGVRFLYADLRKRYSDSRHITKPLELYRQQYCGCIYSEFERNCLELANRL